MFALLSRLLASRPFRTSAGNQPAREVALPRERFCASVGELDFRGRLRFRIVLSFSIHETFLWGM